VQSDRAVLETLAAANIDDNSIQVELIKDLPDLPVVWISHRHDSISYLPFGSRWVLWQNEVKGDVSTQRSQGLTIETISDPDDLSYQSLRSQLQASLANARTSH